MSINLLTASGERPPRFEPQIIQLFMYSCIYIHEH